MCVCTELNEWMKEKINIFIFNCFFLSNVSVSVLRLWIMDYLYKYMRCTWNTLVYDSLSVAEQR